MVSIFWTILLLNSYFLPHFCVKTKIECGYKQCPVTREGTLNVHIIPHSHMDAGWVKTFDEYYYGTRASVSTANVQLIYHSVLSELLHDKRRKFTLSETAYFWRWWKEQRPNTRATFRSLVQEGRVEFAGGGWTHADSATVGYLPVLDMWTWGLRKLNDTLGPCGKPKAAWQIDTYGHTREHASLLAQMGFDGLFLGRVDHREREAMMEEDRMEFMWRGSDVLGKMSDIMSHTLFNLYNAPDGFCFDFLCSDEPIVDDPDTKLYNADKRVNDFIAQIERQAKYYNHDNIMVTMGGDFTYQSASNWFMNIDKLINHVNTHPANMSDINIFYSTPSCYLKAIYLYGRRDKAIHTEKGDHLPYGSDATTYWTGFYTSRPSFKYLVRKVHVFSQIVKQLSVIAQSSDSYELHFLRHATGLVLHHDAITGTSQQHVINDFTRLLSEAVDICTKKASNLLSYLTPTWGFNRRSKNSQQFVMCHQLNMSQCRFAESQDSMLILVYNPLSVKTYHYVRLPAIALHYSVRDFNDEEVEYQMVPLPSAVINLPGRTSSAIQELCFEAENIPAMGYSAYFISPIRDQLEENDFAEKSKTKGEVDQELVPFISNEYLKVTVDMSTGLLESIQHVDGVKIQVSQNFFAYSQHRHGLQSGAYSFRPEKNRPAPLSDKAQFNTIRGALVKEIRQRFSDWITQVIRLYRGEEFVEMEWIIGPVPIGTDLGKEVVSIFTTNVSSSGEFYTDSNGRQMMKRTCWNETIGGQQTKKPVPSCYYPVTSRICIKSTNTSVELCILPDRSQGGTSYNDGEIELMIHRRLLTDDGFGLEESLNEEAHGIGLVVRGKHRILFGNYRHEVDDLSFSERVAHSARKWELEPWLFFTSGDKITKRKWQNIRNKRFSALRLHGLPRHIHILTLEPWKGGSVLLRLENTLEKAERGGTARTDPDGPEDPKSHITVELRKIFLQLRIKLVRETTLGANQWLDDARQMDWSTRYVYSGGEDGILAEDRVGDDDRSTTRHENKDSGVYSEEQDYVRKPKVDERTRIQRRNRAHNRRKRSNNETDLFESTTIRTSNQQYNQDKTWTSTTLFHPTDEIKNTMNTTSETTTERRETTLKNYRKLPKKSQKSTPVVFDRDRQRIPYFEVDEITSSEESFSPLRKKGSRRPGKSHKKEDDIIIDDSDDGVTKSIYDMYYKAKPKQAPETRKKNFRTEQYSETEPTYGKRQTRRFANSESVSAQRRHKKRRTENDSEEAIETSTRTKKRNKPDMPFIRTERLKNPRMVANQQKEMESTTKKKIKRRGVSQNYYEYEEAEDDDDEDDDNDEKWSDEERLSRPRNRWKRSPKEDATDPNYASDPEASEPDYIVTLRPTQIRTFIVWFDGNKRVYSL